VSALAPSRSADRRLKSAIAARRRSDPEFWSFAQTARARDGHVIFQYPAMMVSPMQGELLDLVASSRDRTQPLAYDPFLGSATTMIESMRRGLPFAGADINPLAVLLAKVESAEATRFDCHQAVRRVTRRARRKQGTVEPPADHWCQKWFRADVAGPLAALAQAIRAERAVEIRRLCWATMAEVVRVSGNMRISAPKLQTRPPHELDREIEVFDQFARLGAQNARNLHARAGQLARHGWMDEGRYLPGLSLSVRDARDQSETPLGADVVLTSPPYGDNDTTMPYGQVSYLPLRWMDVEDIAEGVDLTPLQASKSLDTKSLGGYHGPQPAATALGERSPTLASTLAALANQADGRRRVENFAYDLDVAFAHILDDCAPGAHLVITIGDRTVRGVAVETSTILIELLATRDAKLVERMTRQIPRGKRLARRNAYSITIGEEAILIFRAAN
jgi:site-specific DNA-methyltransferase (cytosine-N4-specific)